MAKVGGVKTKYAGLMAKILIVDDNKEMLDTLEHLFTFYEFEVLKAENGKEALSVVEKDPPSLIILDALMPVMNGFETCERLKKNPRTRDIPIIFLSANYTEEEYRLKGFDLGADEYMLKPFNVKELYSRVNILLQKKHLIESLREDNLSLLRQQNRNQPVEDELGSSGTVHFPELVDDITGIYSRTYFEQRLEEIYTDAAKTGSSFVLILLDVDFFRKVNEIYGEHTGDYVLMKLANVILHSTDVADIVFRLGNNRFAVIQPGKSETAGFYEAERIRSAVSMSKYFDQDFFELKRVSPRRKKEARTLTVSAGIADNNDTVRAFDVLHRAEQALHQAKSLGRNTSVKYSELPGEQI